MIENKRLVALIPARGGSKGLPGKNIRMFADKPLIAHTIIEAKKCSLIDEIIVSTDDIEIAEISKSFGASVPFIRPEELSTDSASTLDVIQHCINYIANSGNSVDYLMLLQPTSPLRLAEDIYEAINLLKLKNGKAIVSVCEADHHPFWMNIIPDDLNMSDFIKPVYTKTGRQKLPKYYRLNGSIYLSEIKYFNMQNGFFGKDTFALIMDKEKSVDIDNIYDFKLAEIIFQERKKINTN